MEFNTVKLVLGFHFFFFFFFFFLFSVRGRKGLGSGNRGYEKRFELFLREQLSRTRMHNKQEKKTNTVQENSFTSIFSLFQVERYKGNPLSHDLRTDFTGGGGGGDAQLKSVLHFEFDCQI